MSDDFFAIRERLRKTYVAPKISSARAEAIGGHGFLTEVAGRVILTAPASPISVADELPKELAERWQKASTQNPFYMWLQGRFVEAEKANRNGAFWSTADLQFGEMTVKHGPLNWLHEEQTIIGTIADNAIIQPEAKSSFPQLQAASTIPGWDHNLQLDTWVSNSSNPRVAAGMTVTEEDMRKQYADLFETAQPRPYMAAVSAVWKWVHPDKVKAIEEASATGRLYYSMECIAREMSCQSDETHEGCGKSFDYVTAMTQPEKTCEHIQARASARRMVDPSFLGGAVIVPPTQPGWGNANVEVMRQAAKLAEQTEAAAADDMSDSEWEQLMGHVLRFAGA
jgi:hypothetical protein